MMSVTDYRKGIFALAAALLLMSSCSREMKFDKTRWNQVSDPDYPPPCRKNMVKDLTTHHHLLGIKYTQLVDLLGDPDQATSKTLAYSLVKDYGMAVDPVYERDLTFTVSPDSVVVAYYVGK